MKIYGLFGLSAAMALLSACGSGDISYDASGVFETTDVVVSAEAAGEIMQFNAEEGQTLEANTVLGYIDTTQLSLKKLQLIATRSATDKKVLDLGRQLASLRQQIKIEEQERDRYEKLVAAGAATQKQLDDINYKIQVLQRQLAATSDQIGSSNSSLSEQSAGVAAQIAQIDDQIRKSIIASPIHGVVMTKYAEPGEYAVPGKALLKVADIGVMKLRAYITAGQLTELKIGQKVKVYADQGEKDRKEYEGVVSWISSKAEFTPKTIQTRDERANLVYAVKITVANDGLIKQGMYGDVKF